MKRGRSLSFKVTGGGGRHTGRTAAGMARTKGAIERSSAFKDGNEVDECSVDCGRGLRTREFTAGNPAAVESQKAIQTWAHRQPTSTFAGLFEASNSTRSNKH